MLKQELGPMAKANKAHTYRQLKQTNPKGLETTFREFRLPPSDFKRIIEEYFIALDSSVSLSCLILFRNNEFSQLVSKEIDPSHYNDWSSFRDDLAAISFLRKNEFLKTEFDLEAAALDTFRAAEEVCGKVNHRFSNLALDPLFNGSNVYLLNALSRKIALVLKNFDPDILFDEASWGPGVTGLIKGPDVSSSRKFREEREITDAAYQLFGSMLPLAYPTWIDTEFPYKLKNYNTVLTVPKNAKTNRTIAIEPGINSFLQLGCGKHIRLRLRSYGYNLNSDTRSHKAARKGSLDGSIATVDFSSASDTIARDLVREILPPTWHSVLDSLRSHCYELDNHIHVYEKFSAMGNGFTWELESLIFVLAAEVCCELLGLDLSDITVFGDDITIPSAGFDLYCDFCSFLGFTVNKRKSFSSGYFRESCGSYYFNGVDVKPTFLKKEVKDAKATYRLANSIRACAHNRNFGFGCDAKLLSVWKATVRRIPINITCLGPASSGDSTIHVNFDEACPARARNQIEGYLFPGFLTCSVPRTDYHDSLLISRLWRPSTEQSHGNEIDLRSVTKTRYKTRLFTSQWYNFGSWIMIP